MKIALMSDVHLEFGDLPIEPVEADVLLLAGDIMVAADLAIDNDRKKRFVDFIDRACTTFKHVIFICGNHEHYHGDFATSYEIIREAFKEYNNLLVMDREWQTIDDVTFIGGTLWTDMNKEDPHTLYAIKNYMNDYRIIKDSSSPVTYKAYFPKDQPTDMTDEEWLALPSHMREDFTFKTRVGKFSPEKSVEEHKNMLMIINAAVEANPAGKFVVVGHHAPSKQSTKPQYEDDVIVNGAYSSDLSEFILDRPQIKLWVHGHTHSQFDYMVGSTRIVANPRGYVGYERHDHKSDPYFAKVIEV